jgi:hypothetical protein
MHDIDLAARVIVALNERQFGGGVIALAMVKIAKRMSLTGELTPEVLRFAWSLCGELDLPAVLSPPPPRQWERRNGKRVTAALELPSIIMKGDESG